MYMGITIEAQPGTTVDRNSLANSAQKPRPKLNSDTSKPITVMTFSGISEKEVIPVIASESILETEYFVSPARRICRS